MQSSGGASSPQGALREGQTKFHPSLSLATSIRVCVLSPGKPSDQIECHLITVDLEDDPVFEALSYEWRVLDHIKEEILLAGSPYSIGGNLHYALKELRSQDIERRLWIDALCINQDDVAERGFQVGLMSKIYGQAQNVLVWLGPPSDNSDVAMFLLDFCAQHAHHNYLPLKSPDEADFDKSQPAALLDILERTYWKRVWIIQEIMLARSIVLHCGSWVVPWNSLRHATTTYIFNMESYYIPLRRAQVCTAGYLFRNRRPRDNEPQENLRHWLRISENSICTEPRDKIFGLLALAKDGDRIKIDYTKTLFEIYKDVLKLYSDDKDMFQFSHDLQAMLPTIVDSNLTVENEDLILLQGLMDGVLQGPGGGLRATLSFTPEKMVPDSWELDTSTEERRFIYSQNIAFNMIVNGGKEKSVKVSLRDDEFGHLSGSLIPRGRMVFGYEHCQLVRAQIDTDHVYFYAPVSARIGDMICMFEKCSIGLILREDPDPDVLRLIGRAYLKDERWRRDFPTWSSRKFEDEEKKAQDMASASKRSKKVVQVKLDYLTLQRLSAP